MIGHGNAALGQLGLDRPEDAYLKQTKVVYNEQRRGISAENKQSEISREFDHLDHQVSKLSALAEGLRERLGPVLLPSVPTPAANEALKYGQEVGSAIGLSIRGLSSRQMSTQRVIEDIIERLAI